MILSQQGIQAFLGRKCKSCLMHPYERLKSLARVICPEIEAESKCTVSIKYIKYNDFAIKSRIFKSSKY